MTRRFHLLLMLGALLACPIVCSVAQTFEEVDLAARIQAHPLFQRFDPETRRFLGTESALRSVASLSLELMTVRHDLAEAQRQLAGTIASVTRPMDVMDQEAFWTVTRELRVRTVTLQERESALLLNISLGTWTPDISILPYVRQIARDVLPAGDPDQIILNRLPEPDAQVVIGDRQNQYAPFFHTTDPELLNRHYQQRMLWWRLFSGGSRSVIWIASQTSPGGAP